MYARDVSAWNVIWGEPFGRSHQEKYIRARARKCKKLLCIIALTHTHTTIPISRGYIMCVASTDV